MRKNLYVSMFVLLVAVLVLSACGTAATATPQTVVQVQTQVVQQVVTATPLPPGARHRHPAPGWFHPDHCGRRDLPAADLLPSGPMPTRMLIPPW